MAHSEQLQYIKTVSAMLADDFENISILDIGSFDVNGTTRQFFPNSSYTGVDLTEGPGVDVVQEGDKLDHDENSYHISLSCECFEHNPNWAATFQNMYRMTKLGGVLIITCATTGRPEHGTTRTKKEDSPGTQSLNWDYYENVTQHDFLSKFDIESMFSDFFFLVNIQSSDLYFFGVKKHHTPIFPVKAASIQERCILDQKELQKFFKDRKRAEKFIPKPLRRVFRKYLFDDSRHSSVIN